MTDYPHPEYDQEGKILCQECGKSLNIISPTHLRKHSLTLAQYKEKYKNINVTSQKYKTVQKFCHTTMFAPQPKPLTEIMDEVVVEKPTEPEEESKDITQEALQVLGQQDKNIIPEKPNVKNPMEDMKKRILNLLRRDLLHIQQNYTVQIFTPSGHLLHEFITDFGDPVNQLIVNFPKTFWHNKNLDPAANTRLNEHGWKVIEIHSNAPSDQLITETLKPYLK